MLIISVVCIVYVVLTIKLFLLVSIQQTQFETDKKKKQVILKRIKPFYLSIYYRKIKAI